MKVLIIDNYDSFTFNLYQCTGVILKSIGGNFTIDVVRNDELSFAEIRSRKYDRIIISPGPGTPDDKAYFGVCTQVIKQLGVTVPILGVCLGMQGIAKCFGGELYRLGDPIHGKTSPISHDSSGVFSDLPDNCEVMRYHSLAVDEFTLPDELVVTARTNEKTPVIMGIRHKKYPVQGVQFHPESFATDAGTRIVANFLYPSTTT